MRPATRPPPAASWRPPRRPARPGRWSCGSGPGTPRRCAGLATTTRPARSGPCWPRCGCWTSTAACSAPPSCGYTWPATGAPSPLWRWSWRWPAARPGGCWSTPSGGGHGRCGIRSGRRPTTRWPGRWPTSAGSPATWRPPCSARRAAALAAALGERVLVEIVRLHEGLHAVTVRDGTARLHRLGDLRQVRRSREMLLFALRRLALGHGTPDALASARVAAEQAAGRLDAALFGAISDVVADRPMVLVPPAELQALPWSALPICAKRQLTVAPSAAMWLRAARAADGDRPGGGRPDGDGPGRARPAGVLLAAGPGLDGAEAEIADLAALYGVTPLTGPDATVEAALAGLDGAAVAHIAAHGRVRRDNPLFSALDLADGPLTVYDLERLARAPRLVLLPACQSGGGQVLAGDEVLGLTAALFALGTRTVVATVIPLPDEATPPMMLALHAGLRRGLSPTDALAQARAAADADDPAALATAAGFVCFGAG